MTIASLPNALHKPQSVVYREAAADARNASGDALAAACDTFASTADDPDADLFERFNASERLPLGTPYPAVVDRIVQVMNALERKGSPRLGPRRFTVELILDATGVGLSIGDMVRERGLDPKLVLFTGSDKVNDLPHGVVNVGKAWMVGRMQVLLQGKRLHLPTSPEATVLVKELVDYEISVSDTAHVSFNAKSGKHDDLVIALSLSSGIERSAGRAESRSYLHREPTREEVFQQRNSVRQRLSER